MWVGYVVLAVAGIGWLIAFVGIVSLLNKTNQPWVGGAEQLLMTRRVKDRRVAEMYAVVRDPKNRRIVYAIIGGAALFVSCFAVPLLIASQNGS